MSEMHNTDSLQQIRDSGRLAQVMNPSQPGSSVSKPSATAISSSSKPKVVIDLTGENQGDKVGQKSSSNAAKRPPLKVVNGGVEKTVAGADDKGNRRITRSWSKLGAAGSDSRAVGGGAAESGVEGKSIMKPGEGHKTLVHRAMVSSNRSNRLLQAPSCRVADPKDSSGESDQEAPIPSLAKVSHTSIKPAAAVTATTTSAAVTNPVSKASVKLTTSANVTKPCNTSATVAKPISRPAQVKSAATTTGVVAPAVAPPPASKPSRTSRFDTKPTSTSAAAMTASTSVTSVSGKAPPPVARVVPQRTAAPAKQAQKANLTKSSIPTKLSSADISRSHYLSAFSNQYQVKRPAARGVHASLPPPPPPSYSHQHTHPYCNYGATHPYYYQPQPPTAKVPGTGVMPPPYYGGQGQRPPSAQAQGQNRVPYPLFPQNFRPPPQAQGQNVVPRPILPAPVHRQNPATIFDYKHQCR